jgi:very-short-patch-repair endonuclease
VEGRRRWASAPNPPGRLRRRPRRSTLSRDRIRIHNQPDLTSADITVIDGIPVTSVARTLLDLAATLREDQVERACDQAVINGSFDMRAMEDLLRRSRGRRGVRRLRNVLERGLLGDEYHQFDFLWRKQRVVIETDGGRYHSTGWQRARDAHRDTLLTKHGYGHARIAEDDIRHCPGDAVATAKALLRHGR